MSVYYDVYAEGRIKDKWYYLGPFVKTQEGNFDSAPLYWAQSVFSEVDNELRDCALECGLPEDASQEVLSKFHDLDEMTDWWGKPMTYRDYYRGWIYAVDFNKAVVPKVVRDRPYKYRGYVFKHAIASFECCETNEIEHWLTKDEYEALSPDAQLEYAYYEWNNFFDEYAIYCEIKQKVEFLKEWFVDGGRYLDSGFSWSDLENMQIRLIVCRG